MVLAFIAIVAYFMKPQWWLAAFLVSMFGELIQLWAFASLIKNKELAVRGPYVVTRNPMYLGRFFVITSYSIHYTKLYEISFGHFSPTPAIP